MTLTTKPFNNRLADTILELEIGWAKNKERLTLAELYRIFPEVKEIIPDKMRELSDLLKTTKNEIAKQVVSIKSNKDLDDDSKVFCQQWVQATLGAKLEKILRQIQTFKTLYYFTLPKKVLKEDRITDWQIEQASKTPIDQLITDRPLRRSGGGRFFCLCPFHEERSPSFCIYPDGGGYYCYGCGAGGNAINFAMKFYGYNFLKAVKFLTR